MLLLAKVPQTGQFVCSCVAPKQLASPTARSLLKAADVRGFSSNWAEEDFYVQLLCEVTSDDGNPSESRALCIALTARCLYLPPVVYTLFPPTSFCSDTFLRLLIVTVGPQSLARLQFRTLWETLRGKKKQNSSAAAQPAPQFHVFLTLTLPPPLSVYCHPSPSHRCGIALPVRCSETLPLCNRSLHLHLYSHRWLGTDSWGCIN